MRTNPPKPRAQGTRTGDSTLALVTVSSLFVPGAGHFMIGRHWRGAVWLAGFLVVALIGAAHLLPGLLMMILAAADTWWIASRASAGDRPGRHDR